MTHCLTLKQRFLYLKIFILFYFFWSLPIRFVCIILQNFYYPFNLVYFIFLSLYMYLYSHTLTHTNVSIFNSPTPPVIISIKELFWYLFYYYVYLTSLCFLLFNTQTKNRWKEWFYMRILVSPKSDKINGEDRPFYLQGFLTGVGVGSFDTYTKDCSGFPETSTLISRTPHF